VRLAYDHLNEGYPRMIAKRLQRPPENRLTAPITAGELAYR